MSSSSPIAPIEYPVRLRPALVEYASQAAGMLDVITALAEKVHALHSDAGSIPRTGIPRPILRSQNKPPNLFYEPRRREPSTVFGTMQAKSELRLGPRLH